MSKDRINILLADDHQMLREGLRALIQEEADMVVAGEAEDGESALELARELGPDVVVMDLGMPGMGGMTAIGMIKEEMPSTRIVVLSMHGDQQVITRAMKSGAHAFVPKSTAHTHLMQAIRVVCRGETYLHPQAASAVVDALTDREEKALLLESLSERERQVVRFIALGYTSREIGMKLSLSPKTVDTYRYRASQKLGINHRAELVRFALQSGLIDKDMRQEPEPPL
jgi:two-component system response regulator NreC